MPPPFSQGFVLLLGILVLTGLVYLTALIVGSVWIHNYRKTSKAIAYTFDNDNFCDCSNGGFCQLIVDFFLAVPVFPVDASITDWPMIHFSANLVAAIEAPWAYNTQNKNSIALPVTVIRDAELWAEGNIIGIVAHENDTAFVFFKGTTTKNEWEKNFEFKETSFVASSDSWASNNKSMKLGCGCGGTGGVRHTTNSKMNKNKRGHVQSPFVSVANHTHNDHGFNVKGTVHSGWMDIYNQLKKKLIETLEKLPPNVNKLVLSGHSLGAALATITLADNDIPVRYHQNTVCYAIASPRVGDGEFTQSLENSGRHLHRLVNIADIVNDIPTSVILNRDDATKPFLYSHGGKSINFQSQRESLVQNHLLPTYMEHIKSQLPVSFWSTDKLTDPQL
jgi:hypothetical protein